MKAETKCWLRWIVFYDTIYLKFSKPTTKGSSQLSTIRWDDAREIATKCGLMEDKDIIEALEFFHKQGLALYFHEGDLRDMIFLNPKQLVEAFRTIITVNNKSYFPNEIDTLGERGELSGETMKRIWKAQKYTEKTQKYLRSLMIKFVLAVEDPQSAMDLIVPCLVSKCFDLDCQNMYKWQYKAESITLPLGFSSLVIVGLLRLAQIPPQPDVFKDGCSVMLHGLELNVKIHSSCIELFLDKPEVDLNRAGVAMTEAVKAIRSAQQSLVAAVHKREQFIQGSLSGVCFRCGKKTTITGKLLNKLEPSYSQYCCRNCQKKLVSEQVAQKPIDIEKFENVLTKNRPKIHEALMVYFNDLIHVPALYSIDIRLIFPSNPNRATDHLLDKISVSLDEDLWLQFLQFLHSKLVAYRRLFVSDDDWKSQPFTKHT